MFLRFLAWPWQGSEGGSALTADRDLDHLPFCSPPMPFAGCRFLSPHVSGWKRRCTSGRRFKGFFAARVTRDQWRWWPVKKCNCSWCTMSWCATRPPGQVEYASGCVVTHTNDDPHRAMSKALSSACVALCYTATNYQLFSFDMYLQFGLFGKKLALDKCFEEKITRSRCGRGPPLPPTSNRGEWAEVRRSFQKI